MPSLDLVNDPIPKLFAALAIPASVGFFFTTMYNVTDTWFAGQLGTQELAALSISFPVFFIIIALGVGISQGVTALVANFLGKGSTEQATAYASQAISFGLLLSALATVTGLLSAPRLFGLLGAEDAYLNTALTYINTIFFGAFTFFLVFIFNGILNAYGDTKSYRNVLVGLFFLNVFLNPLFMYGLGPVPGLGFRGIALATITAEFLGMIYMLLRVLQRNALARCSWRMFRPRPDVFREIFQQGYPPALNMLLVAVGIFIITYFLAHFSQNAVAAYGVATRIEQIFLLPSIGINIATLSLVGQNNGAGRPERVRAVYSAALRYGFYVAVIGGAGLLLSGPWLIRRFTDDLEVVAIATQYLRIASFLIWFYIILFSTISALQGLKHPLYGLAVGLVRQIVLPIIFFSTAIYLLDLGLLSIWVSIAIIVVLSAGVMYLVGKHYMRKILAAAHEASAA